MPLFDIKWTVTETVDGLGEHDDGVRHGDRHQIASGHVQKEADTEQGIRDELTEALEKAFPREALGSTYNLNRSYNIFIEEVA